MAPTASPSSVAASPRTPVSHDAWERVETDFDKENDRIIWRYPKDHRLITAPARASLLDEFVHLVDAPSKAIVEFADRHGVLLLCEKHNFPSTHATAIYDDSEQ